MGSKGSEIVMDLVRQQVLMTEILEENGAHLRAEEAGRRVTEAIRNHEVVVYGSEVGGPLWIARYIMEDEWPPVKIEPYTKIRCTCVGPTFARHEDECMSSVAYRLSGFERIGWVGQFPSVADIKEMS